MILSSVGCELIDHLSYRSSSSPSLTKCYVYPIFLNLTYHCSTQVATILIFFDVVLATLLSICTKYETKKLIAISSLMILLIELAIFLASFWPSIFLFS